MSAAGAIRAGGAYVEVSIRDKATQQLKALGQRIQAVGAGISGIGTRLAAGAGAVAAPLAAMTQQFTASAAQMNRLSVQTGASVKSLSALSFAAQQSGVDMEDVSGALEEINIRMGETLRDGTGPAAEAFKNLGLDAQKLGKMAPVERLMAISDALAGIEDASMRGFLADEIMGGDAFKLLPLMAKGSDGIAELMRRAEELGVVLSDTDAKAGANLAQTFQQLMASIKGVSMQIGAALAPALTDALQNIQKFVTQAVQWIQNNRQLAVQIAKVTAVVGASGVAILAIGQIMGSIGAIVTGVAASFAIVSTAMGAILSPIGLVVAAVVGLGVAWATMTQSGQATVSNLITWFGQLKDYATDTWQGIAAALKAGDLKLAAKIAWTELQIIWTKGIGALNNLWNTFSTQAINAFDNVVTWIRTTWAKLTGWLGKQIAKVIAFFTGEDPAEMAAAVQQATDAQVSQMQRENQARKQLRDAAAAEDEARNRAEIDRLRSDRDNALKRARELQTVDAEVPELAKAAPAIDETVGQIQAKTAATSSTEFGLEAFKRFDETRRGLEQQQLNELQRMRHALERGGVVLAEAGA